ncbi:hypothetical protein ENBRE01_1608 [Enteropsectra breve]|nr:hypothetical protein ENBRE01_1608 [Enteropsectra breve]
MKISIVCFIIKGSCLSRFYNLFDTVLQFLDHKYSELGINLSNYKSDIIYLTDLHKMYHDVNLQLQGDDLNPINTKNINAAL